MRTVEHDDEIDLEDAILFCDGSHGRYIPQRFAKELASDARLVPDRRDLFQILESGPDHDGYWEAWDEVTVCTIEYRGRIYLIHPDDDLWLVPVSRGEHVPSNHVCRPDIRVHEEKLDPSNYAGQVTIGNDTYVWYTEYDQCMPAPWEAHDCHGIVSDWTPRSKAAGELVLKEYRGSYRYYDFAATCKKALDEGWSISDDTQGMTKRQIAAAAARQDFEYLRAWCNDEWHWCVLIVHPVCNHCNDVVTSVSASLAGVESDRDVAGRIAGVESDSDMTGLIEDMISEIC